jgi:ankyrin repeat protein
MKSGDMDILTCLMEHFSWPVNNDIYGGNRIPPHVRFLSASNTIHQDSNLCRDAVQYQHTPEMIQRLLSKGADINELDLYGETPLAAASKYARPEVFWMLINAGADVTRAAPVASSLMRKGSETSVEGNEDLSLTKALLDRRAPVDEYHGSNSAIWTNAGFPLHTALQIACGISPTSRYRDPVAARLLLAYGADPMLNERDSWGDRPGHEPEFPNTSPLVYARGRGDEEIVAIIEEQLRRRSAGRPLAQASL